MIPRNGTPSLAAARTSWRARAWHGLAALAFLLSLGITLLLASGVLGPFGNSYYGVAVGYRMPALFALLLTLQLLALGDAVILACLRRGWLWWLALALGALTLPILLFGAIARLDLLRGLYSRGLDLAIACLMVAVLAGGFWIRRWAWRRARRISRNT